MWLRQLWKKTSRGRKPKGELKRLERNKHKRLLRLKEKEVNEG